MRPPGLSRALKEAWHKLSSAGPPPNVSTHLPPPSNLFRSHPNAPTKIRDYLSTVYRSTFKPIAARSSLLPNARTSFVSRLAPRQVPLSSFRYSLSSSARLALRSGKSQRPWPTHTSHLGLQSARSFSSGQGVLHNVWQNVPLALRAAGKEAGQGVDERKWKRTVNRIRRRELEQRRQVYGRRWTIEPAVLRDAFRKEFEQYWSSAEVQGAKPEASAAPNVDESVRRPIVLVAPLEPEYELAQTDDYFRDISHSRLIDTGVLRTINHVMDRYSTHAHRLRGLINRLTHARVFDDVSVRPEFVFGERKELRIEFGGSHWTLDRVSEAASGLTHHELGWTRQWYEIVDLNDQEPPLADDDPLLALQAHLEDKQESEISLSGSVRSPSASALDNDHHDVGFDDPQHSFAMPDPFDLAHSLTPSPIATDSEECTDSVALSFVELTQVSATPISEHSWSLRDPWTDSL